jgi:hypothetical protein
MIIIDVYARTNFIVSQMNINEGFLQLPHKYSRPKRPYIPKFSVNITNLCKHKCSSSSHKQNVSTSWNGVWVWSTVWPENTAVWTPSRCVSIGVKYDTSYCIMCVCVFTEMWGWINFGETGSKPAGAQCRVYRICVRPPDRLCPTQWSVPVGWQMRSDDLHIQCSLFPFPRVVENWSPGYRAGEYLCVCLCVCKLFITNSRTAVTPRVVKKMCCACNKSHETKDATGEIRGRGTN